MNTLLMFSGGKDSFIAACKMIEAGHKVHIITFNSGYLTCEKYVMHGAERLVKKYGNDKVTIVGINSTMATRMIIDKPWKEMRMEELSEKYPDVTGIQSQCFFCQLSMWINAIAYCCSENISSICCGYKNTDKFCTGSIDFIYFVRELAHERGIVLELPLYIAEYNIDTEMQLRGFTTSVLEPKCAIGLPTETKISDKETEQLISYIKENIDCKKIIKDLIPIFKSIKLGNKSLI